MEGFVLVDRKTGACLEKEELHDWAFEQEWTCSLRSYSDLTILLDAAGDLYLSDGTYIAKVPRDQWKEVFEVRSL